MPIYEYRCKECGHKLEALQKLSDAPLLTCPACGKDALSKLLSAAGFQLKGSGWYATDFKSSGSKPVEKKSSSEGSGENKSAEASSSASQPESKSDTKSETKSETKSDTKTEAKTASAPAAGSSGGSGSGSA